MTIVQVGCVKGTERNSTIIQKLCGRHLSMATKDASRKISTGENNLTLVDKVECFMDRCGELGE